MKKVAIKAQSEEHGEKIITYLESIGGKNFRNFSGDGVGDFYFIEEDFSINMLCSCPPGYEQISLPTLPRMMNTWDADPFYAKQSLVIWTNPDKNALVQCITIPEDKFSSGDCWFEATSWRHYSEIEEEIVEMTMEEVCKRLGKTIKIVK